MSKTVHVMITIPALLRHGVELAEKREGEDVFERQARTLDELGYAIVPKPTHEPRVWLPGDSVPEQVHVVDEYGALGVHAPGVACREFAEVLVPDFAATVAAEKARRALSASRTAADPPTQPRTDPAGSAAQDRSEGDAEASERERTGNGA